VQAGDREAFVRRFAQVITEMAHEVAALTARGTGRGWQAEPWRIAASPVSMTPPR
jgi:hypothetical protein